MRSSSAPAAGGGLGRTVETFAHRRARAGRQDRRGPDRDRRRGQARPRLRLLGRPSSIAPRSGWPPFYERAYNERDKSESGSFAQEYLTYFLENEPAPGIAYEYRLVKQVLPGITVAETSETGASALLGDDSRVVLGDVAAEARRPRPDRSRA